MKDLFKAGDKVGSMWGDGVLVGVNASIELEITRSQKRYNLCLDGTDTNMASPSIWHKETGTPPSVGERPFVYPIYKKAINCEANYTIEFTSLTSGNVVETDGTVYELGSEQHCFEPHTNRIHWQDCEAPKWKPTEPTWCWVSNEDGSAPSHERFVQLFDEKSKKYICVNHSNVNYWDIAVPCEEKDIPQWWKDMKC